MLPAAIVRAPTEAWEQFGVHHVMALLIALVACINLLAMRAEAARIRADVWIVAAMAAVHLAWVAFALASGTASAGDLLPLYTCDASIVVGLVWCAYKPRWLGEVLFYWSFVGGIVTLLLPDTFGYALPHFAVVYTLVFHILLLLLGLHVWAVEGIKPSWGSLVPVMVATALLVPPSLVANALLGSDYMFVSRDPGGIFTFLTGYEGGARVAATLTSGALLLVVALVAWFAMDRALLWWEKRGGGVPLPETGPALGVDARQD